MRASSQIHRPLLAASAAKASLSKASLSMAGGIARPAACKSPVVSISGIGPGGLIDIAIVLGSIGIMGMVVGIFIPRPCPMLMPSWVGDM